MKLGQKDLWCKGGMENALVGKLNGYKYKQIILNYTIMIHSMASSFSSFSFELSVAKNDDPCPPPFFLCFILLYLLPHYVNILIIFFFSGIKRNQKMRLLGCVLRIWELAYTLMLISFPVRHQNFDPAHKATFIAPTLQHHICQQTILYHFWCDWITLMHFQVKRETWIILREETFNIDAVAYITSKS